VHYLSTIAVSGDFRGRFYEDDLDVGQRLGTPYAETKFQAEALARARREDLPIDIYRPAAVLGDSRTGEADRIEGPSVFFGLIPWLRRMPSWIPLFGPGFSRTYVHAAPVDFVVDALVRIAAREAPSGQTYCLTDPQPLMLPDFIKTVVDLAGGPRMRGSLPLDPLLRALRLPGLNGVTSGVTRLLGVPTELLTYTGYPSTHDTSHVDAVLYSSGMSCPKLSSYLPVLLEYYERHLAQKPLVRKDYGRPPRR
jgi:thioester reductase-like protein